MPWASAKVSTFATTPKPMRSADRCPRYPQFCLQTPGKAYRHHALNDAAARAFSSAGVSVAKEPVGKRHEKLTSLLLGT